MRIGPFYFVLVSRRNNQPQHVRDPAVYLKAVERLAAALEGLRWMIVAGLAIPLTLGRFYREHRDLDVGIAADDLPAVQRAMKQAGYITVTRLGMFGLGHRRKVEIYLRCGVGSRILRLRPRNIRCFPAAASMSTDSGELMKWIDLYLYREDDGVLEILDRHIRVPMDQPLVGRTLEFGGRSVQVIHLHYVDHVKSRLRCKTHRLDRSVIDQGIDEACARFQQWAPPEAPPELPPQAFPDTAASHGGGNGHAASAHAGGNGHFTAAPQRDGLAGTAPPCTATVTRM